MSSRVGWVLNQVWFWGLGILAASSFLLARGAILPGALFIFGGGAAAATAVTAALPRHSSLNGLLIACLFAAAGGLGIDGALRTGGPLVVVPVLGALISFSFAALSASTWWRVRSDEKRQRLREGGGGLR